MKFARYLEETQTPEWKKAYIDYRGLKKRITAVRREQEGGDAAVEHSSGDDPLLPTLNEENSDSAASPPPEAEDVDADTDADVEASEDSDNEPKPKPKPKSKPKGTVTLPREEERAVEAEAEAEAEAAAEQQRQYNPALPISESASTKTVASAPANPSEAQRQAPVQTRPTGRARSGTLQSFASRFRLPSLSGAGGGGSPPFDPTANGSRPFLAHSSTEPNIRSSDVQALADNVSGSGAAPTSQGFKVRSPTFTGANGNMLPPHRIRPLSEVLPTLTPTQKRFFDKLDAELEKIESFYLDREKEARERSEALKVQLQELRDHRRVFYEAHPPSTAWTTALGFLSPKNKAEMDHYRAQTRATVDHAVHPISGAHTRSRSRAARDRKRVRIHPTDEDVVGVSSPIVEQSEASTPAHAHTSRSRPLQAQLATLIGWGDDSDDPAHGGKGKGKSQDRYDPEEYTHAKKKLKKAVLEHYRMLELLSDYRILNMTGFRKALKKYEKVTKIPVQTAYMREKVEPSAFASDDSVKVMLHEMEEQFAARFSRGDKKKAMSRLRGGWRSRRSHHFSTFRSGILFGCAVPALVDGLIKSYQPETRALIPGWDGLLYVYGILLIPTLFTCLVGLNILVWANSRINYVFIFELDVRTALDQYGYSELPLFLLAMLMYAFWFSFSRVASHTVDPTTWPLIWLLVAGVTMFNPLPIFSRSARAWLLRNISRLLTSGVRRVEFADFWMGDQFCSLIFSLSNLYFLGCVYSTIPGGDVGTEAVRPRSFAFGETWRRCTTSSGTSYVWVVPILLAMLPLFIRLVQSIKRWVDSRLMTHLINGGKYATGMVYYAVYYNWRHSGGHQGGVAFTFWILMGVLYACYAATWDFLMDWSLLKRHARYPLLRSELLYSHVAMYYFAIVSNIVIRFIWVIYIPSGGPNFILRSSIAGFLEMLRRWQWNFIRLENEHLGNVDQYRVTREVPLPYSVEEIGPESGGEDDMDEEAISSKRSWRTRRSKSRSRAEAGGIQALHA